MSLRDKMLAVMADVNASVAEREELVELIAIALLTRKNLFILGDPGQAKSYAINAFRSRITGAKQFERLLSKQTDEEQLFGRLDLSSLIPGSVPEAALEGDMVYQNLRFDLQSFLNGLPKMKNEAATFERLAEIGGKLDAYRKAVAALHPCEPVVQTAGKIPEADIVFLDEIFKCNDGVLNALLTALNERKYTNEGRTYAPEFIESGQRLLSMLRPRVFRTGAYSNSAVIKELVILIGAVDNNKSRKLCHEVFYKLDDLIYIDSGNGMHTGQIVCGIRSGGRTIYRPVGAAFPEVLQDTDKFPTELSCAEASVSAPQSIAANITAATAVVDMIYNILTVGETRVRQITFATGSVNMRATLQKTRRKAA